MKTLQVKKYHRQIADYKSGNGNPRSMFYFMLEDRQGYPTNERKNGYVAYNGVSACYEEKGYRLLGA